MCSRKLWCSYATRRAVPPRGPLEIPTRAPSTDGRRGRRSIDSKAQLSLRLHTRGAMAQHPLSPLEQENKPTVTTIDDELPDYRRDRRRRKKERKRRKPSLLAQLYAFVSGGCLGSPPPKERRRRRPKVEEAPEVKFERSGSFLEEEMRRPQITEEALLSSKIPAKPTTVLTPTVRRPRRDTNVNTTSIDVTYDVGDRIGKPDAPEGPLSSLCILLALVLTNCRASVSLTISSVQAMVRLL